MKYGGLITLDQVCVKSRTLAFALPPRHTGTAVKETKGTRSSLMLEYQSGVVAAG